MKQHILIVEDEKMLYKKMAKFFISKGYTVSAYTKSHTEAMERVAEQTPDIALLDIMIKGPLNGIQVGNTLNDMLNIPLVYISTIADQAVLDAAIKTNPNTYLIKEKTANLDQMLTTVRVALSNTLIEKKEIYLEKKASTQAVGSFFVLKDSKKNLLSNHDEIASDKIAFDDVYLIETTTTTSDISHAYIQFKSNSSNQLFYQVKSIKKICTEVPRIFIKVNQSTIVNINFITQIINTHTLIVKDEKISISDNNYENVMKRLQEFFIM